MDGAEERCDVLVIGAGPAGLTAACYLARYRRRVLVVHDGCSRALRIPLTHNAPGFPGGIAGTELIGRMEEQAVLYGAQVRQDHIEAIRRDGDGFMAIGGATYRARAVIIATGIQLNQIDLPHEAHEEALRLGCLRYCPVCDGFEATDKAVGVLGSNAHGGREALFLREYTPDVTLLPRVASDLSAEQRAELAAAGVKVLDSPMAQATATQAGMEVRLADGRRLRFDVLYPALGSVPQSDLARQLQLELTEEGCIPADADQALSIPGLYAAGDVVDGLDQISVAIGHGAMAATRAHNDLREIDGRVLSAD
jgi:thioredoxin reductase (NADPH)